MKKLLKGLLIGSICMIGANADYKLVLTDKDGVQTEQCIKSYSFSNNLESIAKQKGVVNDVYSEDETLTSKVYLGKPVYRKVFTFNDFIVHNSSTVIYKWTPIVSENLESVFTLTYKYNLNGTFFDSPNIYVIYEPGKSSYTGVHYLLFEKKARVQFINKHPKTTTKWDIKDLKVFIEYTKTTDIVSTDNNEFKSYLHYVPSSSETEELINVNLKNMGIQFLENYTYDSSTNSCVKK